MNKDQMEGAWERFKGSLRETWGKLTDDEAALVTGNRQQFFGKLQENYGVAQELQAAQRKELSNTCKACVAHKPD